MDFTSITIPQLIDWSTKRFSTEPAIIDQDTTLTYTQLGDLIDQASRALVASGVKPGDGVGVWAPNCWQWVVSSLAATKIGALLVPVNTRFKGAEAAYVLAKARVKVLFVVDGFLDTDYSGSLADQDLPHLSDVIDMVDSRSSSTVNWDSFLERGDDLTLDVEVTRRAQAIAPDDIAVIMFTSGTTGHPKGVQVRGGAMIRAFENTVNGLDVQVGDPYLLVNPFFHAFGFNSGVIVCLMAGAINLPVAVFDPGEVLALIETQKVAVIPGPPALFQGLMNHPDFESTDVSSLRSCQTGAASVAVELIVSLREKMGFSRVLTAYGMTETSGLASLTLPDDPPQVAATTSGRAIADVELKVVDDAGNEQPRHTPGELLVRGYQVTPGYLDDPVQTAAAIDSDGWLHTGDVAVMNDDGYIDITDRKKDMFIVGGFNAYPAEIERVMLEHPQIGIVAVIGIDDDRLGEVGAAYIVPTPNSEPDPDEVIAWCRQRMANYKAPRFVWVVDQLPLTASNKVRKTELREDAVNRMENH